jgi:hypothetical protein
VRLIALAIVVFQMFIASAIPELCFEAKKEPSFADSVYKANDVWCAKNKRWCK